MDILNEDEIKFSKQCVFNIIDKLNSVTNELLNTKNPHKGYLKEKLDIINNDVQCLLNIVNKD